MNTHYKEILKTFNSFAYKHDTYTVFEDFLYLSAAAFANSTDMINFEVREKEYMRRIKKYSKAEGQKFAQLLGDLVMCFEVGGPDDYLGRIFMDLELGNKMKGQFFTPYTVSLMMAKMTVSKEEIEKHVKEKGYFTLSEPTCGAGGMVIAMYQAVYELGFNPQVVMRVTSQDVDLRAVLMTFIQTTILGIDNTVILGNTLTNEQREVWRTPARFIRLYHALSQKHEDKHEVKVEQVTLEMLDEYDGILDFEDLGQVQLII